jgi:hypothetical protein
MHPCIIEDTDFWHLVKCYCPYFIEYWNELFLDDDEQRILNHLLWLHNCVYTEQILLTFSEADSWVIDLVIRSHRLYLLYCTVRALRISFLFREL